MGYSQRSTTIDRGCFVFFLLNLSSQALTSIQTNMFVMVIERVVINAFNENLKNLTTPADRRIIVIGFSNVINEASAILG